MPNQAAVKIRFGADQRKVRTSLRNVAGLSAERVNFLGKPHAPAEEMDLAKNVDK